MFYRIFDKTKNRPLFYHNKRGLPRYREQYHKAKKVCAEWGCNMRLFIAINFNDKVKDSLCDSIARLKKMALKGNFTRRENLHLTLVFIGETNKVEAVKQAMASISALPFELSIGGVGRFNRDGGDIYWAGVNKNIVLTDIYNQLCGELRKKGFILENRAYKPHLTLGREVVVPKIFNEKEFAESVPHMNMIIDSVSLMKSERINSKLTYTEVYRKQF
ncbi:MAG: RNA 2',3'-cyclic phosphodiesterase [Dehalobacterium sp.]